MKAIPFLNWTNEDFSWTWDSVKYDFKAHTSTLMEEWKSKHFAKHLTDRELLRAGYQVNDFRRPEFLAKALPEGGIEAPESKIQTEIMNVEEATSRDINKPWCDSCDSRGVRHKKDCKRLAKNVEEEFEGLKA
jgi:hypothetical protein